MRPEDIQACVKQPEPTPKEALEKVAKAFKMVISEQYYHGIKPVQLLEAAQEAIALLPIIEAAMLQAKYAKELSDMLLAFGDENDGTTHPWWAITRQSKIGVYGEVVLAGPFFSRQQAKEQLEARRYHYGDKARTFCFTGYDSYPYRDLLDKAKETRAAVLAAIKKVRG